MKRRTFIKSCGATAAALLADLPLGAQAADGAALERAFRQPPPSARPMTWWHWMNGNITADGITRDLEAMRDAGVGGFQIFQAGTGIPKGPVNYGSPEHLHLLQHAAREADRLGLEFAMHNCPGWSSSGGPWITPELSMQQLVWSEIFVAGGQAVNLTLPQPHTKRGYYRDIAVLAFPSLAGETRPMSDLLRGASSGNGPVDSRLLTGPDLVTGVDAVPAGDGAPAYLVLEFTEPFEARSIDLYSTLVATGAGIFGGANTITLEASDDGAQFHQICDLRTSGGRAGSIEAPATATFAAVRARYFRAVFSRASRVTHVQLSPAARITDWALKANAAGRGGGSSQAPPLPARPTGQVPEGSIIDPASIIDITRFLDRDGRLNWQAPAGAWTILRFGHTSVGIENHPAPDGGGGLECDKYSRAAMDFHFDHFFGELYSVLGPLAAKGLAGAIIDSYEVGMQTWTPAMPQEFQQRRGYPLLKYLPALTGRVVGSGDVSDRFLWDIRRTHSEMMADHYYGRFAELCRRHGMKAYTEPYSGGPFDEMQAGSRVEVPMGEFWLVRNTAVNRSVKLAASIAHANGKAVVGAESFTGFPTFAKWQEAPYHLKAQGDWMYTQGLNEFIFHRYAHQPHPSAVPGMTMGQWGFHFDRTNTWWNQGKAWLEYAARCQNMLRQGLFVADLLYFEGENAPKAAPSLGDLSPAPPLGYDWDTVDRDTILRRIKIENGRITLPDGMSYGVMVLPAGDTAMTVEMLRKIRDLVEQGMVLVGARPESSPSLTGYPDSEKEFQRLATEVWGELDGATRTERTFGKGRVFWAQPLRPVLDRLKIEPDFEFSSHSGDAPVNYIHRCAGDSDFYFIANRRRRTEELVCTFRINGKLPEFWNADTGEILPAGLYDVVDGRVRVPVGLDPSGSVFVVFRSPMPERRLVSVVKDGAAVAGTADFPAPVTALHRAVANNFTVSVWAKPDTDMDLPGIVQANTGGRVPASFVFYPPAGQTLYGPGHAACGLLVGRNGVCVYERTAGDPAPVLTVAVPVAGWSHFALVYKEGAPSIYVNGKLVRQGQKSAGIVHPGLGEAYQRDGAWYFEGDMGDPELFNEALGEDRIRKLAAAAVPKPEEPPILEAAGGAAAELLFWQDGAYSLRDSAGRTSSVRVAGIGRPLEIAGAWKVSFPPNLGAPPDITLPELMSLHKHAQDGVKYFSGTATYSKRISVAANARESGKRLYLDLGRVEVIAEVTVNGKDLGILWKPPFRVDITDAVRAGDNEFEVRVTNLWPNRLIGDEQLPPENEYGAAAVSGAGGGGMAIRRVPDWYAQGKPKPPGGRVTFATWKHFEKDSPLLESGLLGPVRLRTAVRRAVGNPAP
jgi:hypothetical protein